MSISIGHPCLKPQYVPHGGWNRNPNVRTTLVDEVTDWLIDTMPTARHYWDFESHCYVIKFRDSQEAMHFKMRWA